MFKKVKLIIGIALMIILFTQLSVFAADVNSIFVLENTNKDYLIYMQDVIETKFEFAFSSDKNTKESDLNFIASEVDNDSNNVAYIDSELEAKYFNDDTTYMWVKVNDEIKMSATKVELEKAKKEDDLNSLSDITKKITITTSEESEIIKITGEEGKTYYYQMAKLDDKEEYTKLMEIAQKISKFDDNTNQYEKIKVYEEFNSLYTNVVPKIDDTNWIKVESLEISKPETEEIEEKYILWLKDSDKTVDVQFLEVHEKTTTKVEEQEQVINTVNKMPITYDSPVPFVILGIVLLAIIIVSIKIIKNKKDNK